MISNGEFAPHPQTADQRRVESRLAELADRAALRHRVDRRTFLRTASGMAMAFLAMNDVYGAVFEVGADEIQDPDAAAGRAHDLAQQFVFDAQVHFIKDDSPEGSNPHRMLGLRRMAGAYLNAELRDHQHVLDDIKFHNFVQEVFLDSDTTLAILSGAPADDAVNWFLSNDQMRRARELVNKAAGSRRLLAHAVITPGQPGWLDEMDRAIAELRPDSWKGYTMGDPNGPSRFRWRLDDEKLMYPAYEKMVKSGITKLCLHKGLLPPDAEGRMPGITPYAGVDDLGQAARDWPQIDFVIYHCAFNVLMATEAHVDALEQHGRVEWVSDLAAIPERFGVKNVFAEIGSSFGLSAVMNPRFCAGMMGILLKALGPERVFWGTDAVWYGSPQWQIEALRRMEIPPDLRDKFGWPALGSADGPTKRAILGQNAARHYGLDVAQIQRAAASDQLAQLKRRYREAGAQRSNLAYGFIAERI
jgi:predicted TIM-barrel fold metal-dependent hydrolase